MTEQAKYYDKRSEFFSKVFEQGLDFETYLEKGPEKHSSRWREFASLIELSEEQKNQITGFKRQMNVVVMSGIWCGDCARQGPMLRAIEKSCSLIRFRYLDNQENPELQDELKINGANKVPVVVVLSEDFFELTRFGDRHLSVYRRKFEQELGPACDAGILAPDKSELNEELGEWIDFFERLQLVLRLSPMLRKRYED